MATVAAFVVELGMLVMLAAMPLVLVALLVHIAVHRAAAPAGRDGNPCG